MMSGVSLLLLSLLISLGQNLFLSPQSHPVSKGESAPIVQTVGQNQPSVVTIRGYGTAGEDGFMIQSTSGTGFIVNSDGTILTNRHVVDGSDSKYTVISSNGLSYTVKNVRLDPVNDIAVVKIDPSQHQDNKLTPVSLGDSSQLNLGEEVAALGEDPGNIRPTMMTGTVSGIGNTIIADDFQNQKSERLHNMIQTDLELIPGNSGSPLFNSDGQVIGINTATSSSLKNASYAIPINSAKNFLDTVK